MGCDIRYKDKSAFSTDDDGLELKNDVCKN